MSPTLNLPDKLYGRTDIDDVSVPQTDGKMHRHSRTKTMNKEDGTPGPFVLSCKDCIAKLVEMDPNIVTRSLDPSVQFTTHWSPNPKAVPKSEAEKEQEENEQRAFMGNSFDDFQEFREFQRLRRKRPINVGQ